MLDIAWRGGATLIALIVLMTLAPNLSFGTTHYLLEQALGQTPQALVSDYLTAIAGGDRQAALALWQEPNQPNIPQEAGPGAVAHELRAYVPGLEHELLDVIWWRTCSEPAAIDDPNEAGAAILRVAIRGEGQPEQIYLFEVRVPGGCLGTVGGYPIRRWVIADAVLESQIPVVQAWR